MCVRPEHFAQQLEVVVRRARPVTLRSLAAPRARRPGGRELAVTFDDAYVDVLEAAVPILERFEVPATVFVVSAALGTSFWWDRLMALLRAAPPSRVAIHVPAAPGVPPVRVTVDSRGRVPEALHRVLRSSADSVREQILDEVRRSFGLPPLPDAAPTARAVTREELLQLAAHPLIEIGAHTSSHADLSRVTPDRMKQEVFEDRRSLGAMIGAEVEAFAYPHGRFTSQARTAVEQAGFTRACAGHPGRVRQKTDRLALPRLWPSDLDGDRFASFLGRWTGI